ncbi:MAG: potassium transporter TrkA [Chloroflexi bacterium]|nr:potassium transporter TrkA [Chloroflexota bacterium]
MQLILQFLTPLFIFTLIALAAKDIGAWFRRFGLPLITGFLFVGILVGPYVLGIFEETTAERLRFIDAIALAFIAFAAGSELHLEQLRGSWRPIIFIIVGQVVGIYILGVLGYVWLAPYIPFMQSLPRADVIAIAVLGATIMIARSPATAYAVIKELRARGPFTRLSFGVTVLKDSVIIFLFAVSMSFAFALTEGEALDTSLALVVGFDVLLDIAFGLVVGLLLRGSLALKVSSRYKIFLTLVLGASVFFLSDLLSEVHLPFLSVSFFSEPLLICLVAGFYIANFTEYSLQFQEIVEKAAPPIFLFFFVLVGVNMDLTVLAAAWVVILILWAVRLAGVIVGTVVGGIAAGLPRQHNAFMWMAFITQAGVSIGLAQEVADEFSVWGEGFATLIIAVIVINLLIGPPFFKWALNLAGEAHPPAEPPEFDGERDALIFGVGPGARALARQLKQHQWNALLVGLRGRDENTQFEAADCEFRFVEAFSPQALQTLQPDRADAIVVMLPTDEENYRICEWVYEQVGTPNVVVSLRDPANAPRFQELDCAIVEPTTAQVSLIEAYVRSPTAVSLLLGREGQQEVAELVLRDESFDGVAIRDLPLPTDVLILSVRRGRETLITHGHTRLRLGDRVSVLGSPESIEEVELRFSGVHLPPHMVKINI